MELINESMNFRVVGSDNFREASKGIIFYLEGRLKYVLDFFGLDHINKITIYLYDDKVSFLDITKHPYSIQNVSGAYNYLGIRVYADLNKVLLNKILNVTLSGEKAYLFDEDKFKEFFLKNVYGEGKLIPDIRFLYNHGNTYGTFVDGDSHTYNGYVWSYLMVRYLLENYSKEEMAKIMRSKSEIDEIGRILPYSTYMHYKKRFRLK